MKSCEDLPYISSCYYPTKQNLMLKKALTLLFLAPVALLYSQVYNPGPHQQHHQLPRGAYVACVDDIAEEMAAGTTTKYQDLLALIARHNLDFLAFYGLHHIVDNNPQDNPEEVQLRLILSSIRAQFPKIEIAAVGGGLQDPSAGKSSAQHFEQLQTGNFIYQPLSEVACPNDVLSTLGSAKLNRILNPLNPNLDEQYRAEVLKFFARIASFYGFKSPESRPRDSGVKGKTSAAKDYFDHLVLEDEWWWRSGKVRDNLDDHEVLLRSMRSILHLSHACDAKVITYESIQHDSTGQTGMMDQALGVASLADRVLVTHYFKCVPNTLERYCEAIEAWGASSVSGTEFWPLFSSEDQSARIGCSRFDPNEAWNDFWGEWMDTTFTANNPPPDLCPGPGRPGFGYPYETDEAEDLYLERLDSAALAGVLPGSACAQFNIGNYRVKGFMWFTAQLLDPHGRSKVSLEDLSLALPILYPNPASNQLNLSEGEIRAIRDLSGQKFPLRQIGDAWDISALKSGVYLVELEFNNELYFLKFTKR